MPIFGLRARAVRTKYCKQVIDCYGGIAVDVLDADASAPCTNDGQDVIDINHAVSGDVIAANGADRVFAEIVPCAKHVVWKIVAKR